MSIHRLFPPLPSPETGELVIALHCSGGTGRQWRRLAERIPAGWRFLAPDLYGTRATGQWHGAHAFSLADEAAPLLQVIDGFDGRIHMVGHSYGGALALHVCAARSSRITSLTLYEPTAFHTLRAMGPAGAAALAEIRQVSGSVRDAVLDGSYQAGASAFVDYWNGPGAWRLMKPELREEMLNYLPKGLLDFRALISEPTPVTAYQRFSFPVMVIRGSKTRAPTWLIAERLEQWIPGAIGGSIAGAGHMGPVTHPEIVADMAFGLMRSAPADRAVA